MAHGDRKQTDTGSLSMLVNSLRTAHPTPAPGNTAPAALAPGRHQTRASRWPACTELQPAQPSTTLFQCLQLPSRSSILPSVLLMRYSFPQLKPNQNRTPSLPCPLSPTTFSFSLQQNSHQKAELRKTQQASVTPQWGGQNSPGTGSRREPGARLRARPSPLAGRQSNDLREYFPTKQCMKQNLTKQNTALSMQTSREYCQSIFSFFLQNAYS